MLKNQDKTRDIKDKDSLNKKGEKEKKKNLITLNSPTSVKGSQTSYNQLYRDFSVNFQDTPVVPNN